MNELGKTFVLLGVIFILIGALLHSGLHIPLLGKLPGDFRWERKGVHVFFPLASCLLLSVVLTILLRLLKR